MARRKLVLYLVVCSVLFSTELAGTALGEENHCLDCHQPHLARSINCTPCHAGNSRTGRQAIAHFRLIPARLSYFTEPEHPVVVRGVQLLKQLGCRRCHMIGGKGSRLATDLDHLPERVTAVDLEQAIVRPALYMPQFPLNETDLAALVNVLLAERTKAPLVATQPPRTVHFTPREEPSQRVFTKQCGSCHQLLSLTWGVLGQGRTAPNLSGLLTSFYPTPLREKEFWTTENLKSWLDNPRKFRPTAKMPPRHLVGEDWSKLQQEIVAPNEPFVSK